LKKQGCWLNKPVPTGVTLTIEPGAYIRFDGYYKLKVEGTLISIGEEKNMIVFTSNMENLKEGDWNRIEFNGAGGDSRLSWARVEWANRAWTMRVCSLQSSTLAAMTYSHFSPAPRLSEGLRW
jgi:hypothetical protein